MPIRTLLSYFLEELGEFFSSLWLSITSLYQKWVARPTHRSWRWCSGVVEDLYDRLHKRRDKRKAKQRLGDVLNHGPESGPTPEGTGKTAKQSTESALKEAAERDQVGILGPEEMESQPTDTAHPSIQSVEPMELDEDREEFTDVFQDGDVENLRPVKANENESRDRMDEAQRLQDSVFQDNYTNKDDSDSERIRTSQLEARSAEWMEDATLLPIPYRGGVKNVDLNVRGWWTRNPNANEEIQEATRQPIVDNHIRTLVEHLTTSNPKIQGDEDGAQICRKWLHTDVELTSDGERGLHQLVEDVASQMLRYGSAVIIKQRTRSDVGSSYQNTITGREDYPVSNFIVPDMNTLEVFIDKKGRPRKWRQSPEHYPDDKAKTYPDRDVYMCNLPVRNSAMYFWTPSIVMPSLYAIQVLSDLHEVIESHTQDVVDIPAYARVGSKDYINGKVTEKMINDTSRLIEGTPRGDVLIVPHYVEIETLETEDYVESLISVSEYWDKIVRRGTGGTSLQDGIGDSGTRNTSDNLTDREMRGAEAMVPSIQRMVRWLFTDKLMENGIDPTEYQSHQERPGIMFEDIDMNKLTRRESHHVYLWLHDAITHEELRNRLAEDPDSERSDKYYSDVAEEVKSAAESNSRERPRSKNK